MSAAALSSASNDVTIDPLVLESILEEVRKHIMASKVTVKSISMIGESGNIVNTVTVPLASTTAPAAVAEDRQVKRIMKSITEYRQRLLNAEVQLQQVIATRMPSSTSVRTAVVDTSSSVNVAQSNVDVHDMKVANADEESKQSHYDVEEKSNTSPPRYPKRDRQSTIDTINEEKTHENESSPNKKHKKRRQAMSSNESNEEDSHTDDDVVDVTDSARADEQEKAERAAKIQEYVKLLKDASDEADTTSKDSLNVLATAVNAVNEKATYRQYIDISTRIINRGANHHYCAMACVYLRSVLAHKLKTNHPRQYQQKAMEVLQFKSKSDISGYPIFYDIMKKYYPKEVELEDGFSDIVALRAQICWSEWRSPQTRKLIIKALSIHHGVADDSENEDSVSDE